MSMKSLLAPIDGDKSAKSLLETAYQVAKIFNAHIRILHISTDPKSAIPLLGEGMSGAMIEDMINMAESEAKQNAERAKASFQKCLDDLGLEIQETPGAYDKPTCSWHRDMGREDDLIGKWGRLADLIFVPKPVDDNKIYSTLALNAALFDTGRPMLLTPAQPVDKIGEHIAVAWNGSGEGARAVAAAMPFLQQAKSVTVITADTSATDRPVGEELVTYLGWHGIAAKSVFFSPAGHSIGEALLKETEKQNCDMLVMGGYSHSRVRELILGGVTRDVIEQTTLPVLMGH